MIWSPAISFIVFSIQAKINSTDSLTTVRAFISLSIITLVTLPASKLLAVLPQIAASLGCFQRLQAYINSDHREDTRTTLPSHSQLSFNSQPRKKSGNFEPSHSPSGIAQLSDTIKFENATIRPSPKATAAAITDINLTIESGSFTILIGPVGCGKTTLLQAMLGELSCDSGSVFVASTRMSFCSQTPWLLNTSIRESVTGLSPSQFDEEWFTAVMYACALDQDMHQWPDADRSVIGSGGFMLSGGQKQRLVCGYLQYFNSFANRC